MSEQKLKTGILGYPRIGENRELKKATESYWKGEISQNDLLQVAKKLRLTNWQKQVQAGFTYIPSNDFSFYDQTLDMSCLLGNIPPRFNFTGDTVDLDTLFLVARGKSSNKEAFASEMTKWMDANYHYIVPEFNENTSFKLSSSKPFDEFQEALGQGIKTRPVLLGPVSYLKLGKVLSSTESSFDKYSLLSQLLTVYVEVLSKLKALGAEWVQIDEPIFSLDLDAKEKQLIKDAYAFISSSVSGLNILVATYFGKLEDNLETYLNLPVQALHYDAVYGGEELQKVLTSFPSKLTLSLGVVNGRNIWKNDYNVSLSVIDSAVKALGADRVIISSSSSLLHVPITLLNEKALDSEIKNWMSYADQKLIEIKELSELAIASDRVQSNALKLNQDAIQSRKNSPRIHRPEVKSRLAAIKADDFNRKSTFANRQKLQEEKLQLPLFPTTTIGSFPQTKEVREMRLKFKKGEISAEVYDSFLKAQIDDSIKFQEDIDIDLLVHGEFERNDMVEYFGESLEGFVFTQNGWVQSYGSRYVKPPVIFGDVSRPEPMTVYWSEYAQSKTKRPMKGMLTGPITILQWSFVRDDQPRKTTTMQIALAIRDEVVDLETAGIAAIQIDEPAIREGLPLRRAEWNAYLDWAVGSFRLSASGVKDDTQIHTHMCYSEFNDIIQAIADMDADVISIETSRSNMELLEAFVNFKYPNEVGPGVYDIHSPRVPSVTEMVRLMQKANDVLPSRNLWVNPDCGLKTRGWEEVKPALEYMVACAKEMRSKVSVHA